MIEDTTDVKCIIEINRDVGHRVRQRLVMICCCPIIWVAAAAEEFPIQSPSSFQRS